MDATVFALVLFAAACHAGWNAVIKLRLDPFAATMLIAVASGVVAAPLLA
ncbi:MAG: EamA family transporter, partial [Variibacter sp.]|nr:EamA family transporter [Variibacter sp.]